MSRDPTLLGSFSLAGLRYEARVDGTGWYVGRADSGGFGFSYSGTAANRSKAIKDACKKLAQAHAVYDLSGSDVTPIKWCGEGGPA